MTVFQFPSIFFKGLMQFVIIWSYFRCCFFSRTSNIQRCIIHLMMCVIVINHYKMFTWLSFHPFKLNRNRKKAVNQHLRIRIQFSIMLLYQWFNCEENWYNRVIGRKKRNYNSIKFWWEMLTIGAKTLQITSFSQKAQISRDMFSHIFETL